MTIHNMQRYNSKYERTKINLIGIAVYMVPLTISKQQNKHNNVRGNMYIYIYNYI